MSCENDALRQGVRSKDAFFRQKREGQKHFVDHPRAKSRPRFLASCGEGPRMCIHAPHFPRHSMESPLLDGTSSGAVLEIWHCADRVERRRRVLHGDSASASQLLADVPFAVLHSSGAWPPEARNEALAGTSSCVSYLTLGVTRVIHAPVT